MSMKFHANALATFAANNGKISLGLDPKQGPDRSARAASALRLLKLSYPERYLILIGTFCLAFSAIVNLVMPYSLGVIVDSGDSSKIGTITVTFGLIFALGSLFTFGRGYLFSYSGEKIVSRLRRDLFEAIMTQEMSFFDTTRTGELVNRISSDTTLIQVATTITVAMMLRFALQIFGGVILLFVISYKLTFVMLSPMPILGLLALVYGRYVKKLSFNIQLALAQMTSVAEESISNVHYVKTFGNENVEIEKFDERVQESFELGQKMARASGVFQAGAEFASYLSVLVVIWYGSYLINTGEISKSMLLSYVLYTIYVAHATGALSHQAGDFMRAVGASQRVFEILDRAPQSELVGGTMLEHINGEVEFRNVNFSYPSRPDVPVLKSVNLLLEPGRSVAVVGRSGGGKSTIGQLILRLYDVIEAGSEILIDGTPISDLDPKWLRSQIGFVSQEPVLFATSIRENIVYGKLTATDQEVEDAARAAYIHDFIMSLPDGYQTQVGERGIRLSGGQKQRISLARALLKNPPILILDEATSALDAESEHLVQQALDSLMQNRTTLVIAHRLSTIQRADLIVVIDQGQIVEQGTHAELINDPESLYSQLVSRQRDGLLNADELDMTSGLVDGSYVYDAQEYQYEGQAEGEQGMENYQYETEAGAYDNYEGDVKVDVEHDHHPLRS